MQFVTTTNGFEGYEIIEYCGICTGECVLGTGFLSDWDAACADFWGTYSTRYQDKLAQAKKEALAIMWHNATKAGANAIIGVDIDYTTFTANIMGVIVSGTAVIAKPIEAPPKNLKELHKSLLVSNVTLASPVRPLVMNIFSLQNKFYANIECISYIEHDISDIKIELSFTDAFQEDMQSLVVALGNFHVADHKMTSDYFALPMDYVDALSYVSVETMKYIANGVVIQAPERSVRLSTVEDLQKVKAQYGVDAFCAYHENEHGWCCVCGTQNSHEATTCVLCQRHALQLKHAGLMPIPKVLEILNQLTSAKEIYTYVHEQKPFGTGDMQTQIEEKMQSATSLERLYGNAHNQCMKQLQKIIQATT